MTRSDPATLTDAPNLTHLWAQLLIDELTRSGVDTFFLAPGSRSTPLTTAVARHPRAKSVMHVDERGTAFAVLGYGRATGRPAGWITTSGTAVANGLPAVVEAATDGVPMLLLTADRPPELRDTGANQTIDQVKIFGDYVRWQFDLPTPTIEIDPAFVLTTADQAVHRACRMPSGPVQLNCMFRKPLAPLEDDQAYETYLADLNEWVQQDEPYTSYPPSRPAPDAANIDAVAEALRSAERGLVVAGRLGSMEEARAVQQLAEHLRWPLLPDVTSQLRFGGTETDVPRVAHYDQILASEAFQEDHRPDAVLHVGGRCVSKRLRQFLAQVRPVPYVVARPDPSRLDPDHQVTHHVETGVKAFCEALQNRLDVAPTGWTEAWTRAEAQASQVLDAFVEEESALSEPLVARLVTRHIPGDQALVLASSMPVRDAQRYGSAEGPSLPVFANRGASGIDGTIATAAGVTRGQSTPTTLLIGDLALLHDLNSLLLLREHPVIVVAINNDGGGIFHFLPIAEFDDVFEPYFATPQGRSFEQAAGLFDLAYHRPTTPGEFVSAYETACASGTSALIEVRTERSDNQKLHAILEERVAAAVQDG